jgi:hypothetical protein
MGCAKAAYEDVSRASESKSRRMSMQILAQDEKGRKLLSRRRFFAANMLSILSQKFLGRVLV